MNHPFENDRRRPRRGPQGRSVSAKAQVPREVREVPEARVPGEPPRVPEFKAPAALWRGITWQDVPGHDESTQRLNFTLLRRGMLGGHKSCRGLEGEALKAELGRLSARNRGNSSQSYKRSGWRKPALPAPGKTDFRQRRRRKPPQRRRRRRRLWMRIFHRPHHWLIHQLRPRRRGSRRCGAGARRGTRNLCHRSSHALPCPR